MVTVEKWAEHEKNLPYVLFGQLKPYLDKNVNNIFAQECGLYSDKYRVADPSGLYCRIQ